VSSLKRQRKTLKKKVRIRTLELEKAEAELIKKNNEILLQNNKLEETVDLKDKLFSIIAHDIKSPFVSILGFFELLHSNYDSYSEKEKIKMINVSYESGKLVFHLIENLLQWARSQRGVMPIKIEKFDLRKLIDLEISLMSSMSSKKEIDVNFVYNKSSLEIEGDKNMLSIILRNLITNAIKFTPLKGKINIEISEDRDNTNFKISDSGIGMPEYILKNLFQLNLKYTRPGTSMEKGTGLGLLLCKEFVEKHKGQIWVDSTEGIGSSFFFNIPKHQL
jgi:signal transduction histidine kinase